MEAVQEALGEGAPHRRGSGRPRGSRSRAGAGKRGRRSPEQLAAIAARVLAQVRTKQGQRLEEIGRALGTDTGVLKGPVAQLLDAKKLKTKGQKRGTRYFTK